MNNKYTYTAVHKVTGIQRQVTVDLKHALKHGLYYETDQEKFFLYQCDIEKLNAHLN